MTCHILSGGLSVTAPNSTLKSFEGYVLRFFLSYIIGAVLMDMKRMREYLDAEGSDLAWTMVNPPGLTKGPITTQVIAYELGDRIKEMQNNVQVIKCHYNSYQSMFLAHKPRRCCEIHAGNS